MLVPWKLKKVWQLQLPPELKEETILLEVTKIGVIIQKLVDALILFQEKGALLFREKSAPLFQEKGALLFQSKRSTLEDKALVKMFFELLSVYAQVLEKLPRLIGCRVDHSTKLLNQITDINSLLSSFLDSCLKALNYDSNYFEQYYEYDFVAKLNEQNFSYRLSELIVQIDVLCS